jgi:hypothetical protein
MKKKIIIINSKENVDLKERGTFYINIGDGHVNSLYSKKIIFKKYQKLYFKKFKDEIVNSLKNKVLESQKKIKFFFELEIFNLRNDKIKNIDLIINMMVVKHVIKKLGFKEVCLITDDYFTQQIFSDNFSKIKNLNKLSKKSKIDLAIFKIIKFYIKTFFLLIFLKMFKKNKKFLKKYHEACISIKPIFFKDGKENFFKKQKILKYNFLLTDETHLNHSFLDILKIIKNDEKNLVHVESYISFKNLFSSLLKSFELLFLVKKSKLKFVVKGVDLSIFYSNYLIASTINRAKLFIYDKALLVLLKKNEINRFRLYLFEYSFGFYLINLIKTNLNKVKISGYQHGIFSDKLMWFEILIKNKLNKNYLPDEIISFNSQSLKDYKKQLKFKNIKFKLVSKKSSNISNQYISKQTKKGKNHILVLTGTHDAKIIYEKIKNKKLNNSFNDDIFYFKFHPKNKININSTENLKIISSIKDKRFNKVLISSTSTLVYDFIKLKKNFMVYEIDNKQNLISSALNKKIKFYHV